jgi:hypothetical protein
MKTGFLPLAALLLAGMIAEANAQDRDLSQLSLRVDGTAKPYLQVVALDEPEAWRLGLPLPTFSVSAASFLNTAQWLRAYDFDGDKWISKGEMTHAWLIRIAGWASGRVFGAGDLLADGRPLAGVVIPVRQERALRKRLDGIGGKEVDAALYQTLNALGNSSYYTDPGGDGGGGTRSYRGNDNDKDE